jgi:hypothetical protein
MTTDAMLGAVRVLQRETGATEFHFATCPFIARILAFLGRAAAEMTMAVSWAKLKNT